MSALSPVNEFTQFLVSVTVANGMFTNGLVIEAFGASWLIAKFFGVGSSDVAGGCRRLGHRVGADRDVHDLDHAPQPGRMLSWCRCRRRSAGSLPRACGDAAGVRHDLEGRAAEGLPAPSCLSHESPCRAGRRTSASRDSASPSVTSWGRSTSAGDSRRRAFVSVDRVDAGLDCRRRRSCRPRRSSLGAVAARRHSERSVNSAPRERRPVDVRSCRMVSVAARRGGAIQSDAGRPSRRRRRLPRKLTDSTARSSTPKLPLQPASPKSFRQVDRRLREGSCLGFIGAPSGG